MHVPPGVDTGMRLRIEGYGEAGDYGAPAGNLYIEIEVMPDRRFIRRGDHLETSVEITPAQAVLGSYVDVETIDGRHVELAIPEGVQNNTALKIPGEGVRWHGKPGDLLVRVKVIIPERLTAEQRELYQKLLEIEGNRGSRTGKKGFFQDVVDKMKESVR